MKLSQDAAAIARPWGIRRVHLERRDDILMDQPGVVGWGHNGGFHALNLAVQFGARRIVLVGYDMTTEHGVHWHGRHDRGGNPTEGTCRKWRAALDGVAPRLAALGVQVLNASPISALTAYPRCTLEEALCAA